jgi:hypothetical protein
MQLIKEYLHTLFEYKDGNLYWKINKTTRNLIGKKVGTPTSGGYLNVMVDGINYRIHRLIYMMHYGEFPDVVDHIDGNRTNNKIENLRQATVSQNNFNTKMRIDNSSGYKNISWSKDRNKWVVRIQANKKLHQWYVEDLELAELVAIEARDKYHKQFSNHGVQ